MTNHEATPGEIRLRVLEQHKTIRDQLDGLETLAAAVASGRADDGNLSNDLEGLLGLLQTHMRFEDRVLPGVLREADAWGEERVARFHDEHTQQRKMIQNLLDVVGERAELERALLALGFCSLLRKDMEGEETIFLGEDVLRDDPIAVHPEPE